MLIPTSLLKSASFADNVQKYRPIMTQENRSCYITNSTLMTFFLPFSILPKQKPMRRVCQHSPWVGAIHFKCPTLIMQLPLSFSNDVVQKHQHRRCRLFKRKAQLGPVGEKENKTKQNKPQTPLQT